MMASARGQDLEEMKQGEGAEEELENVDTDPRYLVMMKDRSVPKTFSICPYLPTSEDLDEYAKNGWFGREQVRPLASEIDPKPQVGEASVSRDFNDVKRNSPLLYKMFPFYSGETKRHNLISYPNYP